jgi:hypothetical protein
MGLLKFLAVVGLIGIMLWFIYVSQICMGIFFIVIGVYGLLWARNYMESQFSPERA